MGVFKRSIAIKGYCPVTGAFNFNSGKYDRLDIEANIIGKYTQYISRKFCLCLSQSLVGLSFVESQDFGEFPTISCWVSHKVLCESGSSNPDFVYFYVWKRQRKALPGEVPEEV